MLLRERPSVPRRILKWAVVFGATLALFTLALAIAVIASTR